MLALIRKNRNLLLLIQGQFATNLGNQIFDIAMLLMIKELTGSAALMGLAMLMTGLPEVLLAPFGGKLADRYGRLRMVIVADFFGAGLIMIVVIALVAEVDSAILFLILCLVNSGLGFSAACFNPAISALVPSLVTNKDLESGNAAHQFSRTGGQVLGQGLGGMLYVAIGVVGAFSVNALSFLLSAISETRIKVDEPDRIGQDEPISLRAIVKDTLTLMREVLAKAQMRRLLIYIAIFHLCLSCLPILLPFFADKVLALPNQWTGFFMAAYTAGVMAGFVLVGHVKPVNGRFTLIAKAGLAVGVTMVALSLTRHPVLVWALLVAIGIGIGLVVVNLITELQLSCDTDERAGVMGIAQAIGGSSLPLGMALTGILLDSLVAFGVGYAYSVASMLAVAGAMALMASASALWEANGKR